MPRFEGEQREQREAMTNLSWGLLASLFAIYAIMALYSCSHGTHRRLENFEGLTID